MKLVYTLHRINGNIEPFQVVEMTVAQIAEIEPYGAVREPTADEAALYRLANPVKSAPKDVAMATDDREQLKVRAGELGLTFQKNIKTPKLAELVAEAEAIANDLIGG